MLQYSFIYYINKCKVQLYSQTYVFILKTSHLSTRWNEQCLRFLPIGIYVTIKIMNTGDIPSFFIRLFFIAYPFIISVIFTKLAYKSFINKIKKVSLRVLCIILFLLVGFLIGCIFAIVVLSIIATIEHVSNSKFCLGVTCPIFLNN